MSVVASRITLDLGRPEPKLRPHHERVIVQFIDLVQ